MRTWVASEKAPARTPAPRVDSRVLPVLAQRPLSSRALRSERGGGPWRRLIVIRGAAGESSPLAQSRRGVRLEGRVRAGAADPVQPAIARLHRRALQGQGREAGPPPDQQLLRRLEAHRRDRVEAPHGDPGARGPRQRRLLEPALHRREPRADRASLRRQLLAQAAARARQGRLRRSPEAVQLHAHRTRRPGLHRRVRAQGRAGAGGLRPP